MLKRLLPERLPSSVAALFSYLFLPHLEAIEITDGNVNYSFCVAGRRRHQLFVKQAHAFLKWQPQMSLERERMARELRYFSDAASALGPEGTARYLPRIVHFDPDETIAVMEYLDGYRVLFNVCFEDGAVPSAAAEGLGRYMAHVHAHSLRQSAHAAAEMAATYWNPALRAIQLEHVFTVCFTDCERGRALAEDAGVMAEVAALKAKYLGYSLDDLDRYALCHGDLHPGGVMLSDDGAVKVIDPK